MSTGPQGIQGYQGAKGSRGPKGVQGWGYGTTTGPTGGIGKPTVVNLTSIGISGTIPVLTGLNSGTLYRVTNVSTTTSTFQIVVIDITNLVEADIGKFWIFNNDTQYAIFGYSGTNGADFRFQLNPQDSITCFCNAAGNISTI
jgi:hypothetical protein